MFSHSISLIKNTSWKSILLAAVIILTVVVIYRVIISPSGCSICPQPFYQNVSNLQLTKYNEETQLIANDVLEFNTIQSQLELSKPYHLMWDVTFKDSADKDMELQFSIFASYQLFWDGELIGKSGEIANEGKSEVAGPIENIFLIPQEYLTAGVHHLKIIASSQGRQEGMPLIRHTRLEEIGARRFISIGSLIPTLFLSASVIVGFYFLLLFFSEPTTKAHLYIAISCLSLSLFGFSNQWPFLIGIDYDSYPINRMLARFGQYSFSISFVLFYISRFKLQQSIYVIIYLILISIFSLLTIPLTASYFCMIFSLFFTVILLLQQYKDKYRGYFLELITLISTTVFAILNILDFENFFVVFPIFIIVLLAIHTFNIQQQRLALQKSLLKASQLESSLLRKNIQPHFILNSLMSITQWIEDNPKKSIEFVESLADEFRLFAKIAGQPLIPLSQDIKLAQYHLNIMSFRLEKNFELEIKGNIEKDWIPPGIMHTLVENGVSHNKYLQQDVIFKFERYINAKEINFCLFTPLGKKRKSTPSSIGTGTGSKYINSQLEQVYAQHYVLLNEETEEYWTTRISIPLKVYYNQIDNIRSKGR